MAKLTFDSLVVSETPDFIFINKPHLVASLDERTGEGLSILKLAKEHSEHLQLCHRLDKETSGVLLIAKNPDAYRTASMAFEHRRVTKLYHAVSDGIHNFNELTVNLPILPLPIGIVKIDKKEGKPAETVFNTLEVYKKHTLVECKPLTGRMHQIRIHLATQKASITADTQYGGVFPYQSQIKKKFRLAKDEEERPMINRFALHARTLKITLPTGEVVEASADYPKDLEVLIKLLRKNS